MPRRVSQQDGLTIDGLTVPVYIDVGRLDELIELPDRDRLDGVATLSPQFTVWTRDKDNEQSWVEQLSTDDLDEAARTAAHLGVGDTIATIWERGRFKVTGRRRTDNIMFWWSENDNERMASEPQGRGVGWPEHHDDCVSYEPAGSRALATTDGGHAVAAVSTSDRTYVMVACAVCGLRMPKNEAVAYTSNVEVGHSSGSSRTGSSWTQRSSARSFSDSSTRSQSRSSGRTYYKRQTVLLCPVHYSEQVEADKAAFKRKLQWIAVAILIVGALFFSH